MVGGLGVPVTGRRRRLLVRRAAGARGAGPSGRDVDRDMGNLGCVLLNQAGAVLVVVAVEGG